MWTRTVFHSAKTYGSAGSGRSAGRSTYSNCKRRDPGSLRNDLVLSRSSSLATAAWAYSWNVSDPMA